MAQNWLINNWYRYKIQCHPTEQNFKIILELAKNSKLHLLFDTSWVKNGRLEQEMQIMQKLKSFKCCHTLRSINWQIYNIQSYPKTQNFEKFVFKNCLKNLIFIVHLTHFGSKLVDYIEQEIQSMSINWQRYSLQLFQKSNTLKIFLELSKILIFIFHLTHFGSKLVD